MEAAGCVFLPAAGSRYGSIVENYGRFGCYSTSSGDDFSGAFHVTFQESEVNPGVPNFRIIDASVRLVTEVK